MQQVVKVMSPAELQVLVSRLGAKVISQAPGKVAYQGGGATLVAASMADGRLRVILTKSDTCTC